MKGTESAQKVFHGSELGRWRLLVGTKEDYIYPLLSGVIELASRQILCIFTKILFISNRFRDLSQNVEKKTNKLSLMLTKTEACSKVLNKRDFKITYRL